MMYQQQQSRPVDLTRIVKTALAMRASLASDPTERTQILGDLTTGTTVSQAMGGWALLCTSGDRVPRDDGEEVRLFLLRAYAHCVFKHGRPPNTVALAEAATWAGLEFGRPEGQARHIIGPTAVATFVTGAVHVIDALHEVNANLAPLGVSDELCPAILRYFRGSDSSLALMRVVSALAMGANFIYGSILDVQIAELEASTVLTSPSIATSAAMQMFTDDEIVQMKTLKALLGGDAVTP